MIKSRDLVQVLLKFKQTKKVYTHLIPPPPEKIDTNKVVYIQ